VATGDSERLRENQLFGRYRIVRLLGEGGMGAVYEAVHPVLKKRFAIKTLLPSLAELPDARARFLREGEAAARINHPNVVAVLDVGTEGTTPYLVMEYLEGETLEELMTRRQAIPAADAVDLMLPVISAVAAGHDQGVIHRDLKPQNIFLARGPWGEAIPKVLDFGVSKLVGDRENAALTGTQAVLGTVAYMSPEQARGARGVDAHSDQYAIGLILYEMVTGRRAHTGDSALEILHHISNGRIVPPRTARPDLPVAMEAALVRCLAHQTRDRFPSLRALGQALLPLAGDKARMGLADGFREPATLPEARAGEANRTVLLPSGTDQPRAISGGTQILPAPGAGSGQRAAESTFREVASELGTRPTQATPQRAATRARIVVVAGVVAAGGIAAGLVLWRREPPPRESAAAAPSPSTPASPMADSPAAASAPSLPSASPAGRRLKAIDVRAFPETAEIVVDDGRPVRGRLRLTLPVDGASHRLRVWADGYVEQTIVFGADEDLPGEIRLDRQQSQESIREPTPEAKAEAKPGNKIARPARAHGSAARAGAAARAAAAAEEAPATPASSAAPAAAPSDVSTAPRRGANNALIIK
jgi:tRNA A-37 threonylcarbamoyl transferase component Bud32